MHGVMKNIAHLCTLRGSDVWGPDSWQKVVVCIVADGRKQCDKRVLSILATLGVYQGGIAKNVVNDKPVKAHIYEVSIACHWKHLYRLSTKLSSICIVFASSLQANCQ